MQVINRKPHKFLLLTFLAIINCKGKAKPRVGYGRPRGGVEA